jgi:hypothetical protein
MTTRETLPNLPEIDSPILRRIREAVWETVLLDYFTDSRLHEADSLADLEDVKMVIRNHTGFAPETIERYELVITGELAAADMFLETLHE